MVVACFKTDILFTWETKQTEKLEFILGCRFYIIEIMVGGQ